MKRLFLSLAILACLSLTVGAQNTKRGGQRELPKELNLTTDQQQKIEAVNSEFKTKMSELRSNSDLKKEDKQTKMKELMDQHQTSVNNVLTPEQQTKLKELKAQRGNKEMKDRQKLRSMNDRKGRDVMKAQRGDRKKDLNLTDDQKQKMKALNEEYRTKNKELAEQRREALNKIYTPEQQSKMKEMREGRKMAFDKRKGDRGMRGKLDEASTTKLKTLKEDFEKEKKAVELSRIAPDAQKQKISELRDKYQKERRQIMMDARKTKTQGNKPV